MINDIRYGKLPSRPMDPSQNQWLYDQIWDTITICWSGPLRRCELSVVYHIFSTPSPQDLLVEFPPVGRKNLVLLAEELWYIFLILPLDTDQLSTLRPMLEYIYNAVSRNGTSQTISSSAEAALAESFCKVTFSR